MGRAEAEVSAFERSRAREVGDGGRRWPPRKTRLVGRELRGLREVGLRGGFERSVSGEVADAEEEGTSLSAGRGES